MTITEALQRAARLYDGGRLAEAEEICRRVLAQDARCAEAWRLLGLVAARAGHGGAAIEFFGQALAARPDYVEAMVNLGNALHSQGRFADEAAVLQRAIALRPDVAELHNNLGNALKETGRAAEALAAYDRAIQRKPELAVAHLNRGLALAEMDRSDEAIGAFGAALRVNPSCADAYYNLGIVLTKRGRLEEALEACRRAIVFWPDHAEAHNNLGSVLTLLGRYEEAEGAYRQAIALRGDYVEAYSNLGSVLGQRGRLDEATTACRRAVELQGDYIDAHLNLGHFLEMAGRHGEAIAIYRQVLEWRPDSLVAGSNLILTLHHVASLSPSVIAEEQRRWGERHAAPMRKFIRPHGNRREAERRLRIGYVSPDFRGHPVGRFIWPLLVNHDRQRFEVFCYANVTQPDAITPILRGHADGWRNIVGVPDEQVAEQIRADGIDILVDLAMHTADNRLRVFACKPAPVQVTYLAYASGTGLETMDYRLTDPYLDPPENDALYSERSVRLPRTYWCYRPVIGGIAVSELPALRNGMITFGCLNNTCKVTEPALAAWCTILRQVPRSRLILHAYAGWLRERACELSERAGVDPQRLQFVARQAIMDYFGEYHRIDIALDTIPYAGGTTTCDALWMGIPVVSLAGKTGVSRGGLSVLSNVGLAELVASSMQEYVEIAAKLAGDLPRLAEMRRNLRGRMEKSPLMDEAGFARDVEEAYRWMWREWCRQ